MKKNNKLTIEVDKQVFKKIYYFLGIIMSIFLIIKCFQYFLIPMTFILLGYFLQLLQIYPQMDINFKFFAIFIIMFIIFKILSTFVYIIHILTEWIYQNISKLKEVKQNEYRRHN